MVLEKSLKLATRKLFDAAVDVSGIPDRTPGQMLLQALEDQRLNADRGESWATKLRQLPALEVKHPPRSDMTIFGLPDAETRGLLQKAVMAKAKMDGVYNMLLSREERHEAAWGAFVEMKDANKAAKKEDLNRTLTTFKRNLGDLDQKIADIMYALEDHLLMKLELHEVEVVWTKTAERLPLSVALVEELDGLLVEVERRHKAAMDEALYAMIMAMNDVAHIDPQQVTRIVESESLELNRLIISNKRTYADLIRRMQNSEVQKEDERRQRWEAAMQRWRIVRTHQLMDEYEDRIRSPEFAEPPERLAMFGNLRSRQEEAIAKVLQHTETARAMVPPAIHPTAAEDWRIAAVRIIEAWYKELDAAISGLQNHEEGVEVTAQELYAVLRERCVELKGYPEEELEPMLQQQCVGAATERREKALELLHRSDEFLLVQAQDWHRSLRAVSLFLARLAMLYDTHKINWKTNDDNVFRFLAETRDQFNSDDAKLEQEFSDAVVAVQQGYSEKNLDDRVQQALHCLHLIENNYRDFHASMVAIAQKHPKTVQVENEVYEVLACTHLGVKPRCDMPITEADIKAAEEKARLEAEEAARKKAEEEEAARLEAEAAAATKKGGKKSTPPAKPKELEPEPEPEPEPVPEPEPEGDPVGPPVVLQNGTEFPRMAHLYDKIHVHQGQQPVTDLGDELQELATMPPDDEESEYEEGFMPEYEEEEPLAPPRRTAELQGLRDGVSRETLRLEALKEQEEEAQNAAEEVAPPPADPKAKAKGGAEPVEEAEEEEPEAEELPPLPQLVPPLTQLGDKCLVELEIPRGNVVSILDQIRIEILEEMDAFAKRTQAETKEWSSIEVEEVTEELDENLRRHRPRAGRVEEDVRLKRSVELIGQRRKIDTHMKALTNAIRAEIDGFNESFRELKQHYEKQVARIVEAERLLGTALSVKSLEIRKREAVAMRAIIDKDTETRASELISNLEQHCMNVKALNTKFDRDILKGFEHGGKYAQETMEKFREKMRYNDLIVDEKLAEQTEEITALKAKMLTDTNDALLSLKRMMPPHRQDLTLIEAIDKSIGAARKRADKCFEASNDNEATIASCIKSLDEITAAACELRPHANMTLLETCEEMLRQAEALRAALIARGLGLKWIKSTGVQSCSLAYQVKAAGQVDSNAVAGEAEAEPESGKEKEKETKDKGKGKDAKGKGKDAKKGGKKGDAGAAAATDAIQKTEVPPADTIEAVVEAEIAKSQEECDAATDEYHANKKPEREITRPNRIPAEADALKEINANILDGIRQQTRTFVEAARKELRIQVVNTYRLLPRLPVACSSILVEHEIQHAARMRDTLDEPYEDAHRQFKEEESDNKKSLRPALRDPNRVDELQALKDKEATRLASSKLRIKQHARVKIARVTEQATAIEERLGHLLSVLLGMMDNYIYPEDLEAIPEGDESIRTVDLKNVLQLQRLNLAQEEATVVNSAADPGRPHQQVSWSLAAVDRRPQALGWGEQQWAMVELPQAELEGFEAPEEVEPEDREVQALDTPSHRHAIRAYRASAARMTKELKRAVAACKDTTAERLRAEDHWGSNWETLVSHMDN